MKQGELHDGCQLSKEEIALAEEERAKLLKRVALKKQVGEYRKITSKVSLWSMRLILLTLPVSIVLGIMSTINSGTLFNKFNAYATVAYIMALCLRYGSMFFSSFLKDLWYKL